MLNIIQEHPYKSYSSFIRETFGERVQKVTIDAGFTCPNRDGSLGWGGCTYCNNDSFSQDYSNPKLPVTEQIDIGIEAFSRGGRINKYLAYFQSYSNTYAGIKKLKELYNEALSHPKIVGLVLGTRPDCISEELLNYLEGLNRDYFISIEYGVESTDNSTLKRINRCHTYEQSVEAFELTAKRNIHTGAHLILGLPGESEDKIMEHAQVISKLPLNFLKIHQLQIVKGTVMAKQHKTNPEDFHLFSLESYIDLVIRFLERLRPDLIIERFVSQAPKELLIAPNWGLKNFEIVAKIEKEMLFRKTWQGRLYS